MSYIEHKTFSKIDLQDPFFDTLKEDYIEFSNWYQRKAQKSERAFVLYENNRLLAFLYLKIERDRIEDVNPPLEAKRRLKVGTFKVEAHGTKLGERFIKRIFDTAISMNIDEIYLTIFSKHDSLIGIFKIFGFFEYGRKTTANGTEIVLIKQIGRLKDDILKDYPMVQIGNRSIYSLAIYPKWHTRLFSDSILNNESVDIIKDVSHTNSIHKIYLCSMQGVTNFKYGDIILIYRTSDGQGHARFRSVITSVCVVNESINISQFNTLEDFLSYCRPYSIFTEDELREFYQTKKYPYIIKMTYNLAFKKRVTNGYLKDYIGLNPNYWGVFEVTRPQFTHIIKAGEVNESLIVN
jgi:hypothetical protein